MNKLLTIFFIILSFTSFSQRNKPLEFQLSNPMPRVGEEVEFFLELDPIRDDFDEKIIGKDFKDKRFGEGKHPFTYEYSSSATYKISYKLKKHGWNDIPFVDSRYNNDFLNTQRFEKVWVDSVLSYNEPCIYVRYRKIKRKHYLVVEEVTENRKVYPKMNPYNRTEVLGPVYEPIVDSTKFAGIIRRTDEYYLRQVRDTYDQEVGYVFRLQRDVFEIIFKKDTITIDSNSFSDFPKGVHFEPLTIIKPQTVLFKPIIKGECTGWKYPIYQIYTEGANEVFTPDDSGFYEIEIDTKYFLGYQEWGTDEKIRNIFPEFFGIKISNKQEDTIIRTYNAINDFDTEKCHPSKLNGKISFYSYENQLYSIGNYKKGYIVDTLLLFGFDSNLPKKMKLYKKKRLDKVYTFWDNGNVKQITQYHRSGFPTIDMAYFENGKVAYEKRNDTIFHYLQIGKLRCFQTAKKTKSNSYLIEIIFFDQNGKKELVVVFKVSNKEFSFHQLSMNELKLYASRFIGAYYYSNDMIMKKHEIIKDGVGKKVFLTKVRKGDGWLIENNQTDQIKEWVVKSLKHYFN